MLDANLSYRVAEALRLVGHSVRHVSEVPSLGKGAVKGQQPAEDEDIAKWCGQTETVLVTIDSDFQTRWVRSGALKRAGVEVIVFPHDLPGLDEQHRIVTACLPGWQRMLGRDAYGHRVWRHNPPRKDPELMIGKKRRPRSRRPPVAVSP